MKKFYKSLKEKAEKGALKKRPKKMGYLEAQRAKRSREKNLKSKKTSENEVPQRLTCRPEIRDGIKSILKNKKNHVQSKGFFKKRVKKKGSSTKRNSRKALFPRTKYPKKNGNYHVQRPKPRVAKSVRGDVGSKKSVTFSVKEDLRSNFQNQNVNQDNGDISSFSNNPEILWSNNLNGVNLGSKNIEVVKIKNHIAPESRIAIDSHGSININSKPNRRCNNCNGLSKNREIWSSQRTVPLKPQNQNNKVHSLLTSNLLSPPRSLYYHSNHAGSVLNTMPNRKINNKFIYSGKNTRRAGHSMPKSRCRGCKEPLIIGRSRSRKKILEEIDKNRFEKKKQASLAKRRMNYKNYTFRLRPKRGKSLQCHNQENEGMGQNKSRMTLKMKGKSAKKIDSGSLIKEYTLILKKIENEVNQRNGGNNLKEFEKIEQKIKRDLNDNQIQNKDVKISAEKLSTRKNKPDLKIEKVFDTVLFLKSDQKPKDSPQVK